MEEPERDEPDAAAEDVEDLDLDAGDTEGVVGGGGGAVAPHGPAGPGG